MGRRGSGGLPDGGTEWFRRPETNAYFY